MRIYPPVWSIGRLVEEDYLVDKYTIPKGSSILMSQYVMHHDSRYTMTIRANSILTDGLMSLKDIYQDLVIFHLEVDYVVV